MSNKLIKFRNIMIFKLKNFKKAYKLEIFFEERCHQFKNSNYINFIILTKHYNISIYKKDLNRFRVELIFKKSCHLFKFQFSDIDKINEIFFRRN